jgi:hypothetical protein
MHRLPFQDFDGVNNTQKQLHMPNILGKKNAQLIPTLIWKMINVFLLSTHMP